MRFERDGFSLFGDVTGDVDAPLLVLIAGLGEQIGSVEFPVEQRRLFEAAGFRVLVLDNRDNGFSVPVSEHASHEYSLLDMADDVAAVAAVCGAPRAHLVGASMGGFIARWTAIRHPQLVASLTIVMSGSGAENDDDGPQTPGDVVGRLFDGLAVRRPRDQAIDRAVDMWRWLWGSRFPFDEAWVRDRVTYAHDRSYRPEGVARNLGAFGGAPGLWRAQGGIACPTLVVHGDQDPCFSVDHAEATATQIPGATLQVLDGMGHTMHEQQWGDLAAMVLELRA